MNALGCGTICCRRWAPATDVGPYVRTGPLLETDGAPLKERRANVPLDDVPDRTLQSSPASGRSASTATAAADLTSLGFRAWLTSVTPISERSGRTVSRYSLTRTLFCTCSPLVRRRPRRLPHPKFGRS
jgi:hypothetical protein